MRFSSLLLSLAIFLLNAEFCNTAKIRMCANHFCTEPVYKAVGKEDWENNTPGFINIFKGDEIVVFGVEGQYFDAEARGMRGFLPREKAEISETLLPPTVKFDPFYKEDGTNGSAEPASQSAEKQNDGAVKSKATKTQEQPTIEQTTDSGIVAEKYNVVEEKPVLVNEQPVVNNEQRATPVLPNSIAEQPSSQQPVEESETEKLAPAHPVLEEPVAKKEVLEEPVSEEPVSEEQVAEQPVAEQLGAEQPGAEQPVVEKPVVEKSVVEQPVAEQPVVEQPVAEKSVAEQPVVEKSVPEQPVAEQPVPEQPVAEKSVAEKPVVEKPVTEDHTETQQNPPENVYQPEQTLTSERTAPHDPPMEESQHENQEDSGSSVVSTYKEEEDDLGFPEDFDINKITEEQTAPEIPEKVPEMPAETPDIPQNTPEIPADTTETHKDSTPLEPDDSELTKTERRQRRYQDVRQVSLPVYCKLPLVGGLCDSVGSDATVLILCTLTVPLILAVIFLFTSPGPGSPQKEAERVNTEVTVKPDPRVLETLENHGKTQQQLAGHIDDVSTQLTQLTQQINDHRLESVKFQEQLTKTQNKLNLSLEKNVLLERDNRTLNNKLAEQTRYNTGFADLEKSLKDQIQILEEKVDNRDNIIKTQEFTATSTSEQIATLQSQLEETIRDRDETLSSLNTANSNVEELTQELEMTQDKLDTTSELFEQAQSDTEAWTVRVQILSLELADTQSQLTSLEESLKEKESDLDILRECLVDMRSACQSETHFDFDSHFRDMIDVNNLKSENEKIHTNLKEMSEDLEEVTEARDLFEERIQEIEDEMEELKAQKEAETTKKIEYSTKLETLTTYFKDKEDNLHCRLSELQVKCKQLEEENSEVNILFYKEELSKLKKAHAETERNLTLQIQTNERKAKEAYSQLRSKDVKLKEKEEQLKKLKKGGKVVVHEDGPPIGPSFMDFPMIRKTRGDNPDSPCESLSSLTSAEDLEKRRKHAAEGPPPPLDYERQPYPPDFRPDYDGSFPPRHYNEGYMPPPRDLYRDFPPAGFDRDFLPPPRSLDPPRSRDSSRPPSVGGPILPPRDVPILSHRGGPDPYFPPRETTGSLPHLPPRDEKPLLPSRNSLPPRKTSTGANGQDMLGSKVNLNITDQNSNSFSLGV